MLIGLPTEIGYTYTPKLIDYVSINKIIVTRLNPKIKYNGKSKGFLKVYVYDFDEGFEKLLIDVLYIGHTPIVVKTKSYNDIIVFQYNGKIQGCNMNGYIDYKKGGEIFYSINL